MSGKHARSKVFKQVVSYDIIRSFTAWLSAGENLLAMVIIPLALLRITEDGIGLVDSLEDLSGVRGWVLVGMVFESLFAESLGELAGSQLTVLRSPWEMLRSTSST